MTKDHKEEEPTPFMPINQRQLIFVALAGMTVGLIVWGLTYLLDTYVVKAILCQGSQAVHCGSSMPYAEAAASVIATGAGVAVLAKLQVFRPLLVVLASMAAVWGLVSNVSVLPWYGMALSCVLLYTLTYVTFAWIARIRQLWLVIALLLVAVVAVRLILTS